MKKREWAYAVVVGSILLAGFFLQFGMLYNKLHDNIESKEANRQELQNFIFWIKNNTEPNDTFIAEWEFGTVIQGLAGRKVIASTKVYPSEARLVADKYNRAQPPALRPASNFLLD